MKNLNVALFAVLCCLFFLLMLVVPFVSSEPIPQANPTEQQATINAYVEEQFRLTANAQNTQSAFSAAQTATAQYQATLNSAFAQALTATVGPTYTSIAATQQALVATRNHEITSTVSAQNTAIAEARTAAANATRTQEALQTQQAHQTATRQAAQDARTATQNANLAATQTCREQRAVITAANLDRLQMLGQWDEWTGLNGSAMSFYGANTLLTGTSNGSISRIDTVTFATSAQYLDGFSRDTDISVLTIGKDARNALLLSNLDLYLLNPIGNDQFSLERRFIEDGGYVLAIAVSERADYFAAAVKSFEPSRSAPYVVLKVFDSEFNLAASAVIDEEYLDGSEAPSLAFSPVAPLVFFGTSDFSFASDTSSSVGMFNYTNSQLTILRHDLSPVTSLEAHPTEASFATAHEDQNVFFWDANTGQQLRYFAVTERGSVSDIAFSADGALLFSVGIYNEPVRVWDAQSGNALATLTHSETELFRPSIELSDDGSLLAFGIIDRSYRAADRIELWGIAPAC